MKLQKLAFSRAGVGHQQAGQLTAFYAIPLAATIMEVPDFVAGLARS
jgi:hypothetical protein